MGLGSVGGALRREQGAPAARSVFFAIQPPPAIAARAARLTDNLKGRFGLTGPEVPLERLHISLNSLGLYLEPCEQVIARGLAVAASVGMAPFLITMDRAATWGRGEGFRPMVLSGDYGVEGVSMLYGALHAALADAGLAPRAERPIEPHMTLLRDRRVVPEESVAAMSWMVRDFVLIDSWRGKGRHRVLGRIGLGDRIPCA